MNELPPPPSGDDALFGGDRFALLKPELYSSGQGSRPPVGFSTSMLTKQPNDCCMDETYERCATGFGGHDLEHNYALI